MRKLATGLFTLLELLMVIAIISILATLLLPALSKARAAGNLARCKGQLRQVAFANLSYAEDNTELFSQSKAEWIEAMPGYLSLPANGSNATPPYWSRGRGPILWCPQEDDPGLDGSTPHTYYLPFNNTGDARISAVQISTPSSKIMMLECRYINKTGSHPWNPNLSLNWLKGPYHSFPHTGNTSLAFFDGHIEQARMHTRPYCHYSINMSAAEFKLHWVPYKK